MSVEVHAKHAGALLIQHINAESTVEQLQIALARDFGLDASSVKLCVILSSFCRGLFSNMLRIVPCAIPRRPFIIFRRLFAH